MSAICAEVDVLTSFAEVAISAPEPFVRPTMTAKKNIFEADTREIYLGGSRHPCI